MDTTTSGTGSFFEKYGTALAVLVGALIIGGAFVFGQGGREANTGEPVAVDIKDVADDSGPFIGDKNAPVAMAIWFDYQCPFCKQFELETMPQVYENYVKTGKVKVYIKDFQFLGPDSESGAAFARAVWEAHPDRFYDWFIAMANAQDEEHGGFGDDASIDALTRTVPGIDGDRVAALVAEKRDEYLAAAMADRTEGQKLGINSTPSVVIGTTLFAGAQSYANVAALLDAELAK